MNENKPIILIIRPEVIDKLDSTLMLVCRIILALALLLHGPAVLAAFN